MEIHIIHLGIQRKGDFKSPYSRVFLQLLDVQTSMDGKKYIQFLHRVRSTIESPKYTWLKDMYEHNSGYPNFLGDKVTEVMKKPYYTYHCFVMERLPCFFFWKENANHSQGMPLPVNFDPSIYLHYHNDLVPNGVTDHAAAVNHFLSYGYREGRKFYCMENIQQFLNHHHFEWQTYLQLNPDLFQAGLTNAEQATLHFIRCGVHEKRQCCLPQPESEETTVVMEMMEKMEKMDEKVKTDISVT